MAGEAIKNEEQYQNSLNWLMEKAKILEHPLLDEAKKAKLMKKFDYVCEKVREYNIKRISDSDQDFRKMYEDLGILPKEEVPSEPEPPQQPENESINLSDWIDDE